jgi:hypothetical protein
VFEVAMGLLLIAYLFFPAPADLEAVEEISHSAEVGIRLLERGDDGFCGTAVSKAHVRGQNEHPFGGLEIGHSIEPLLIMPLIVPCHWGI